MFSGIIKDTGRILKKDKNRIFVEMNASNLKKGDSISINGVCLTAVDIENQGIWFDVSEKTFAITNLKSAEVVNIELPLKAGDFISGHFVTGHVDTKIKILKIENFGKFKKFFFELPDEYRKLIALRGSVALDGISLTVAEIQEKSFSVNIIPETLKATNFSFKKEGDFVNFEADVFARYISNFLEKKEGLTKEKILKWL